MKSYSHIYHKLAKGAWHDYMYDMVVYSALAMAILVGLLLVSEHKQWSGGIWIFKLSASTLFLVLPFFVGEWNSDYGRMILGALALSWLGDLFLIFQTDKFFKLGLVSFLLAHVAYCFAFFELPIDYGKTLIAFFIVVGASFVVFKWLFSHLSDEFRYPVVAYMLVISLMVILSFGATFGSGNWILLPAAVLFYLSDISVARHKFVSPGMINKLWGLPFYYAAQFLFALSI